MTGLLVKPIEAHTTLNYFSDSAFWHVPMDFKKMEEEQQQHLNVPALYDLAASLLLTLLRDV